MPVDDIVVMLMADYGVNLYGNTIIVNPKFAAEKPEAVKGFLRAFLKGLKDTVKDPSHGRRLGAQAQRRRQEAGRARTPAHGDQRQHRDAGGEGERLRRRSTPQRLDKAIDQIALTYEFKNGKPKARRRLRRLVPAARGRPQGELTRRRADAARGRPRVSAFVALDGVSHTYGARGGSTGGTLAVDGCRSRSKPANSPPWSGRPAAASRP